MQRKQDIIILGTPVKQSLILSNTFSPNRVFCKSKEAHWQISLCIEKWRCSQRCQLGPSRGAQVLLFRCVGHRETPK